MFSSSIGAQTWAACGTDEMILWNGISMTLAFHMMVPLPGSRPVPTMKPKSVGITSYIVATMRRLCSVSPPCRNVRCVASKPPSTPCSQLHSWMWRVAKRCAGRNLRPFEIGEFRLELGRPHIGPHDFATLDAGIGARLELRLDARDRLVADLRNAGHVGADRLDVELEAVIDAAQTALLRCDRRTATRCGADSARPEGRAGRSCRGRARGPRPAGGRGSGGELGLAI